MDSETIVSVDKDDIVSLVVSRLQSSESALRQSFEESRQEVGVRYCFIDELLPVELAKKISACFPSAESMRLMSSFREKKYTSKRFDEFDQAVRDITFAIQDPRVIAVVGRITGIKDQLPDASLYAGGLSAMVKGHYLGPHIDNSHDGTRMYYRTLNLLYYVTPNWTLDNGGNLELWDKRVKKKSTIVSRFNRLVIMETTPNSWHSVSKVQVDAARKCVSNYYFSPLSPTGTDYFNVTSFSAPPDQPIRRLLAGFDNRLRQALRKIVPDGLGKKDIYSGPEK